jgi:uncharacterized protein (DUF488 family)
MTQLSEQRRFCLSHQVSLHTIGYEGRDIDGFISQLQGSGINTLIDVRDIPLSRKKGFSKTPLSERLKENNIEYIHLKELGSPKNLREKVKSDGDYEYFFNEYLEYIQTQAQTIEDLYQIIINNNSCIMCFEKDPFICHRLIVAEELKRKDGNSLTINHI